MNRLSSILILQLASHLAFAQPPRVIASQTPGSRADAVVTRLYRLVAARPEAGQLYYPGIRLSAPYLSRSLRHKIALARACSRDWLRQNRGRMVKAPFSYSEAGIFSGGKERTAPASFRIMETQAILDGSFRIDVKLTYRPVDGPGSWLVAAIVVPERGRFVVDDIIFPKERPEDVEYRLASTLGEGCNGSHWVGYRETDRSGSDPKGPQ